MKSIRVGESKSIANRLQVLASFSDKLEPNFITQAEDVISLKEALSEFKAKKSRLHLLAGGTSFRFLLARVSREPGSYQVFADKSLLRRPQQDLYEGLQHLGVEVSAEEEQVFLHSKGWSEVDSIEIDCARSTQFASALLLSSVQLDFDFCLKLKNLGASRPYLEMTIELLRRSGVPLSFDGDFIKIPAQSTVKTLPLVEADMSSAFQLAAAASWGTALRLLGLPAKSLQADAVFLELFSKMGIAYKVSQRNELVDIEFSRISNKLKPVDADFSHCPDLLPATAALCGLAEGTSILRGVEHTQWKESDRIEKSLELLRLCGARADYDHGTLSVLEPVNLDMDEKIFHPAGDHRMAMAAAVLKAAGCRLSIQTPEVVNKSCPDFWEMTGVQP